MVSALWLQMVTFSLCLHMVEREEGISLFHFIFFVFFHFQFCIGVFLINNVVIVSGGQQRDPAIHTHVPILPQTPLPSRLLYNIEQSSTCYTVGPCLLPILNSSVYMSISNSLTSCPLGNHNSTSLCFVSKLICIISF